LMPGVPYMREYPPESFYPNGEGKMLKTPIDSSPKSSVKCSDPLPEGTYPLPRCISNVFEYDYETFDVEQRSELRSKRRTRELAANGTTSLPFNLSETFDPNQLNTVRNGINHGTSFLRLNTIYGTSDEDLSILRDRTSCKLLTSDGDYPAKDTEGRYMWGIIPLRSWTLFTLAINTVWIREHNRLCDELFQMHGNAWSDQQYFDEARRWNIAYFQKTVSEEYLGTILGRPLPLYNGYKPDLVPGIDTFFATVTFKYGHSELSDTYRIQDDYGDTIAELTLNQITNQSLLETFGLNRVLRSMALQRQEEVDIFFSDSVKNFISPDSYTYDLPAFDISRTRDRGIPLYNSVREAYGLSRKNSWNEITSNSDIQNKLQFLYPNGPDTLEAYVGAYSEDHLEGSNFGELVNASLVTQFNRLRETDEIWWESDSFNQEAKDKLRNTTFRDIIIRNLPEESQFVKSIWTVQPQSLGDGGEDAEYPSKVSPWSSYIVRYRLDDTRIHFKVELQTLGGEGWFGMGFEPSDIGMKDAEFIIGI
ncbi:15805_t:CDS:2, partial [Funneliformis geosporum]